MCGAIVLQLNYKSNTQPREVEWYKSMLTANLLQRYRNRVMHLIWVLTTMTTMSTGHGLTYTKEFNMIGGIFILLILLGSVALAVLTKEDDRRG